MKTIKGFKVYEEMPQGWTIVKNALTAPRGYILISNNKSRWSGARKTGIIKEEQFR